MASKECQTCVVEGRGKVQISQKDKKAGGQYWINPDGSPHYFFTGEVGGKAQFVHPRTRDEFDWAKEHKGLNTNPTYQTPYEDLGIKQDPGKDWTPWLGPGSLETDLHKTVISDTNNFIQNIRKTCYELARDWYPDNADIHEVRITALGIQHDFIQAYSAALIKQDLLKVEKIVDNVMLQLKKG